MLGEKLAEGQGSKGVVNGASSGWQPFTSRALQGSALGLFSTFITDLNAGFYCTISKFSDNITLGSAVSSLEGQEAFQRDIDRLEHWAMINRMKFGKLKCRWILHLGSRNAGHKYKLVEEWLESSRDLGVLVGSSSV